MGVWYVTIACDGARVSLQYEENGIRQECGTADLDLMKETIGFACSGSAVWDRVVTPPGTFTRQIDPPGGGRA